MTGGHDSRPPDLPARLGRYAVVRRLGAGGMAEVFLARSRGAEGTDKLVVLKRILPAFAASTRFRAMFVDEARVALRLNHPNVVQVYGFESDGPTLLLVMEYVDGPDLAALAAELQRQGERMPAGLAAWIVREVARGLHYAHERRDEDGAPLEIVHRDVSPGNVLLSHDGVVKLGDFGIAKARLGSGEEEGAIKGKFTYMSPEQARSEPVDRRADLYSVGVVLTELLAGRPLGVAPEAGSELLRARRRGISPDVHALAPEAPEALRAVAARLLAPEPDARFQTARELDVALTRVLRVLEPEWDGASLEQYLARYFVRPSSVAPPPDSTEIGRVGDDAPTVAHPHVRERGAPSAVRTPGATAFESPALLRERVHVAVVVGRVGRRDARPDAAAVRALFGLIEAVAFKADATLERGLDGRFTLVLGLMHTEVDHALRAVRLCRDVLEAAQTLAGARAASTPALAFGVARGVATAARGASGTLLGFEIVDDALSFADALCSAAADGEALVTAGVYRLARRAFVLSETGGRGAGASQAYSLSRAKTRAERERDVGAVRGGLVGRAAELAQLRDALARAGESGHPAGLLVVGEAGVGKSALLAAFEAEHAARGAVVRVALTLGGAERSFGCIAQLLAEVLGIPDEQASEPAVLAAAIERAVEIAALGSSAGRRAARRALEVAMGLADDDAETEAATARELLLVARRLLTARALMGPLAVVVDGADMADRHGRAMLAELLRKPPTGPVLVVLSLRDDDALLREARSLPRVQLAPLDGPAREALVAAHLGVASVEPELSREIAAVAGGNPLIVLEALDALRERGRIVVDPGSDARPARARMVAPGAGEPPLPATLEEVLAWRVDALPPEARALLRWCAVVDAELPRDLLETLAGEPASQALLRLLSDGILVRARGARDVFTFAHAALVRVARAAIDPTQLPAMHARIAAALEKRPAARGTGALVLARHREAAGATRPAARAYLECASALRSSSQPREALGAYARALALLADATDPEGCALRFAAHLGCEEIHRSAGRSHARRAEILALRAIALEAREPRLIARALGRQARYKLDTGLGSGIERDVAAATRAARRAGEPRTEAEAKRVLAVYLGQRGRYAEAVHAADEALAALGEPSAAAPPPGGSADDGLAAQRTTRVETLIAKGALLRHTGEIAAAIDVYAEAYALLSRHGPRRLLAHVLNNLGVACFARGDYRDAARLYLGALAVHRELGQRERLGVVLSNAGQAYAALGDDERALVFLRKALEVFAALGGRSIGLADTRVALAEIYARRGETDLALAEIATARADADAVGSRYDAVRVRLGAAVVSLARREWASARANAAEAERLAASSGLAVYALHARAYGAEAAAAAGDHAAAQSLVDAVLADPAVSDPWRIERGDLVLAACERALRALGAGPRADALAALLRRRAAGTSVRPSPRRSMAPPPSFPATGGVPQ